MHRGTMFAIVNDNEIWKSTQFNGGMGVDCFGKDCYKELENVKNLEEFKQMIAVFNKKYFEYENENLFFKADEKTHPFISNNGEIFYDYSKSNNQLDLFYDIHTGLGDSNSNYIKNLSNKTIEIICSNGVYVLPPKEIMITNYDECINNTRISYDKKLDESLNIKRLEASQYIETNEEKTFIENIVKTFEQFEYKTNFLIYDGVKQGFEIEKWTNGGVDMIHTIQFENFRDSYNIDKIEEELKKMAENFSIDDEIDLHRQGNDYKQVFSITESLKDFTEYHQDLQELSTYFKDKFLRIYQENEKEIAKNNCDIADSLSDY